MEYLNFWFKCVRYCNNSYRIEIHLLCYYILSSSFCHLSLWDSKGHKIQWHNNIQVNSKIVIRIICKSITPIWEPHTIKIHIHINLIQIQLVFAKQFVTWKRYENSSISFFLIFFWSLLVFKSIHDFLLDLCMDNNWS